MQGTHSRYEADRTAFSTGRLDGSPYLAHGTREPHGRIDVKVDKFI
jgi:hypothetical protein